MPITEGMLTPEERSRMTADYAVLNGVVKALSAQNDILRARADALERDRANDRIAYLELRDQVYELATPPRAVKLEVAQSEDPRIAALESLFADQNTWSDQQIEQHGKRIAELEKRAVFPHQHDEYEDVFERLRDDMKALANHQHEPAACSLEQTEERLAGLEKARDDLCEWYERVYDRTTALEGRQGKLENAVSREFADLSEADGTHYAAADDIDERLTKLEQRSDIDSDGAQSVLRALEHRIADLEARRSVPFEDLETRMKLLDVREKQNHQSGGERWYEHEERLAKAEAAIARLEQHNMVDQLNREGPNVIDRVAELRSSVDAVAYDLASMKAYHAELEQAIASLKEAQRA